MPTVSYHSPNANALIKKFEGFVPTAYQDQGGVWTVGYGTTWISNRTVERGDTMSEPTASLYVEQHLCRCDDAIGRIITVPLTQNEWDALASLVYNIGAGNFATAHHIISPIFAGDMEAAANGFLLWNKVGGEVSVGLLNRRHYERTLFLTPDVQ